MTDEEQAAVVQTDDQEQKQPAETVSATDAGDNFGEDAANNNFGEDAGNGFEDNFGLGDDAQSVATIPAPPPAPKKKEPAPPVTPRNREEEEPAISAAPQVNQMASDTISVTPRKNVSDTISVNAGTSQKKKRQEMEEELFDKFQLLRVPQKICTFAAMFRPYLAQHPDALKNLEPLLCDEASVEAVRLGMKRLEAFPTPEFRHLMFYHPIGMLTDAERTDWKAHLEKYSEYAKLTNGEYSYYDPPQFFYRHGAIYLDPSVTDRLAGGIFYQCGAFCGASLIAMNQYKPEKMYAFEPSVGNLMFVQANIAHAGLKNLELYKICVADEESQVTLPDRDQNGKPCMTVSPMAYLDLFEQRKNVKGHVAWIQADVNGMGLRVIKGAEKMIKRDKPLITVAIYHEPDEFFGIAPLLHEWVPEYKFMVRRCQCSPTTTYNEITLIAYIP